MSAERNEEKGLAEGEREEKKEITTYGVGATEENKNGNDVSKLAEMDEGWFGRASGDRKSKLFGAWVSLFSLFLSRLVSLFGFHYGFHCRFYWWLGTVSVAGRTVMSHRRTGTQI